MSPEDKVPLDLLVLGSGIGGLTAAIQAAQLGLSVGVLTKNELIQSATRWAQGGVAAALPGDPDDVDRHLADTLRAGAGLCDVDAVSLLVEEGPSAVNQLIGLGAAFDRDSSGELLRAREGGHSVARIVHAGGSATGAEIERALVDAVRQTAARVWENWFALELIVDGGDCRGVIAISPRGDLVEVRATHTLLATGGLGQLFSVTTNPPQATGDGLAMALRAGVVMADVEFVQFHPTALHHKAMPRPLLSEALRGHGAILRDRDGNRFVDELAPRDVVSRAMAQKMVEQSVEHLWLDATVLTSFDERFPNIAREVRAAGLDPTKEWLPIAPAAHYVSGGVLVDLDGASSLPYLWACGEVACSGVHGANRLASNSLLEGMVFAPRVARAVAGGKTSADASGAMRAVVGVAEGVAQGDVVRGAPVAVPLDPLPQFVPGEDPHTAGELDRLQRGMTAGAGVVRSTESLSEATGVLAGVSARLADKATGVESMELRNLADVGWAVVVAATRRQETRGAHTRIDHESADEHYHLRFLLSGTEA